jgi:ABC-2 type transport system permease protein
MTGRPGSALWLLSHELRLSWFKMSSGSAKGPAKRGMRKTSMAIWIAAVLILHVVAFIIVKSVSGRAAGLPPQTGMIVTAVLAALATLMLSTGLRTSVEALFERADLDLLLSSPLSSRSIFTVRLAAVVLWVASTYLLLLAPLAHMGLALGQFRWLAIYPAIISIAMMVASAAMLFTLGLVRLLGVRRTRVVAQIIGALSGASLFLLSQLFGNAGRDKQNFAWLTRLIDPASLPGPDSLAWLPGRALLGEPLPQLLLAIAGGAAFFFTVRFTHAFFVRGVQQSAGMARRAAPPGSLRFHFGRGLAHTVILKEWRLIARDPQLISQVLLQLLFLLPLCFMMFRNGIALPGIAASICFLCSSIAGSLGWIVMSAEDAPDLLLSAPCPQTTIRRAKLVAVVLPPLALVLLPLGWIALSRPGAAALMLAMVAGALFTTALTVQRFGKPSVRGDFKSRAKGNWLASLLEGFFSLAWAGLAFLLLWLLTRQG